jgi:hypothetical protein
MNNEFKHKKMVTLSKLKINKNGLGIQQCPIFVTIKIHYTNVFFNESLMYILFLFNLVGKYMITNV